MGQIQQGINQFFTTAGFMAGLSPELKKFRQVQELKGKSKVLQEQADVAGEKEMQERQAFEELGTKLEGMPEGPKRRVFEAIESNAAEGVQRSLEAQIPISEAQTETAKELFELKPSKQTFEDYMTQKGQAEFVKDAPSNFKRQREEQLITREEAMRKLQNKGMDKVQQRAKRRNFMKALGAEQVNFGGGAEGTVSGLPKNMQKAIASSFSKAERKELMDKYYGSK